MSRWILQSGDGASGAILFEQLAQMLADCVVAETDHVRPEQGGEWQSIDSVIGLCRAADKLRIPGGERMDSGSNLDAHESARVVDAGPPIVEVPHATVRDTTESTVIRASVATINVASTAMLPRGPAKPVSLVRVLLLSASIGVAAWVCWSVWNESRRFPRPAHLTNSLQPWILPGIGAVSGLEAMMLAMDAIAIFVFLFWWFRTKCKMH